MRTSGLAISVAMALLFIMTTRAMAEDAKVLKAGIIGLDTSHAPAFAKLLNGDEETGDLAGVKIVAAFPGGSPDISSSADRVEGYTDEFRKMGIAIAPSIDA